MSTICIIPARGGSVRIKGKNINHFHGKPIIAYSIEKAEASYLFQRIIVSTDSHEIAAIAKQFGAEVWMRSAKFAHNDVGTQEVVKECIDGLKIPYTDTVCCIYATSPLMSVGDLMEGYRILNGFGYGAVDYVMSVGYPPLQDAAQFYWGAAHAFGCGVPLVSTHTRFVKVDESRVCDINTPDDWNRAFAMYAELTK